jgi:hypothetical protein
MPAHLAIMDTMSWFGTPKSFTGEPVGDPSFGNWDVGPMKCVPARPPTSCDSTGNREVSSRYHPFVGTYSSSGIDAEGLDHIKLMLSNERSSCDDSARIDAFAVQLNGTHYTSLHGGASKAAVIALDALNSFLDEADAEGRTNAVVPMDDASWYWTVGHYEGLSCSDDRATCLKYLTEDVEDMLTIAKPHASALRINGKLVLHFFVDSGSGLPTPAEWATIFGNARAETGLDFYSIGTHAPARYFAAFDALAPWVEPSYWWQHTSGGTVEEHAAAYAKATHEEYFSAVTEGKVVFGNIAPGFDDFTEEWGKCVERQLPVPASGVAPRDLDFMRGNVDYLKTKGVQGVVLTTWDDWTEGTFFEPSVEEGTTKIVTLRQELGSLFGDTPSTTGDEALSARWTNYGKTNPCTGVSEHNAPALCTTVPKTCAPPTVLEPTASESVGPAILLRVTGGSCIDSTIAYIDDVEAVNVKSNTIDQWVSVSMGTHMLSVNGWDASGAVYRLATNVTFTRTY